ncbi:DUF4136 domain-containing protein [Verrucomicrobia bacterium S94]|nr:DUF4136 domain-containing protein [Verrucomicrobia bacterium S94]
MNRTVFFLFTLSAAVMLTGCSSLKVHSRQAVDFDFGSVKTYKWVSAPQNILNEDDTYLHENVQIALNNQLMQRGWTPVPESDDANVQIVYYIKLMEHQEYAGTPTQEESRVTGGFTYNADKGSWGYSDQPSDLNIYNIEIGTLTLLIYSAQSGEKIWDGTLETRIDRSSPVEKQQRLLNQIAFRIIDEIPE